MFINTAEKAVIENAGLAISDLEHFAETSNLHELTVDTVTDAARNVIRIEAPSTSTASICHWYANTPDR